MSERKIWKENEVITLIGMAHLGYSVNEIADKLDRTKNSVQSKLVRYAIPMAFPQLRWERSNDVDSPQEIL